MLHKEIPIVLEQSFPVTKEILWNAITERDQMVQWFFENIETFEPKVGFKTKFVIENEGKIFPHIWTIIEVEQFKKIVYNWKYKGYAGDSNVIFELIEQGKHIKLKLTHKVLDSFPKNIPEFKRESCLEGWNYFIKQRLKNYLDKILN
ncbi:MAG: ATPase [Bacteroidetes bacterium]|nr:MAG: ATPase [Bacteroidota bacterium]